MDFLYTGFDLTLQKIMGSNSEMEYITTERNLVPVLINQICTEIKEDILIRANYRSNILVKKNSVDCFKSLGYNLFEQFESETIFQYYLLPILKRSNENTRNILEFGIVTKIDFCVIDVLTSSIPPDTRTRPSVLMGPSDSAQSLDAVLPATGRNRPDENAQKHKNDSDSFEHQYSSDYALNNLGIEYPALSSILCRFRGPNGFVESIEITTSAECKGGPPVDLALIWNRKYCNYNRHVAFKLDHPLHYKREYDRIRQSPLSVFDSLMRRQTSGPLSQRKVLEVVAGPHYSIYPPTDKEELVRFNHFSQSFVSLNMEGHLCLRSESSRSFDSYHMSPRLKNEWLACRYYLRFNRNSEEDYL